jgi:hypothetical protein
MTFLKFLLGLVPWDYVLWCLVIATGLGFAWVLESEKGRRGVAALSLTLFGTVLGALTVVAVPEPLFRPLPIPGASAIALPLLLGLGMHGLGKIGRARGRRMSHVATWYGGAGLGFGLALGRLIGVGVRV